MPEHEAEYLIGDPITRELLDYQTQLIEENEEMRGLLKQLRDAAADNHAYHMLEILEERIEYYVNQ